MTIERASTALTIVTSIVALIMVAIVPNTLQLPIHWNSAGEVDRYANATTALLFPPAVMLFILALLFALKFIEPRKANLENSRKAKNAISFTIVLLMATMEAGYVALIYGMEFSMHLLVTFSIGVALAIIGNYLSKTRSNFFIGIRTPWTLSSDSVWQKTHRLSGRLFMLTGIIIAITCWFIPLDSMSYLIVGLILPSALIPTVYSWWLWKQEQHDH